MHLKMSSGNGSHFILPSMSLTALGSAFSVDSIEMMISCDIIRSFKVLDRPAFELSQMVLHPERTHWNRVQNKI